MSYTEKDRLRHKAWVDSHKEELRQYGRDRYKRIKPLRRKQKIERYLPLPQYEKLLGEQNNKCSICQVKTTLVIDHNHKTLAFRGLLCNSCNKGLGFFYDNIQTLKRAIKYLEVHHGNST